MNRFKHSVFTLWRMFYFHGFWIVLLSLFAQLISQSQSSLFGYNSAEPMLGALSLSPKFPFRDFGIPLFTYALVHESATHWLISNMIFFYFAMRISLQLPPRHKGYLWHLSAFGIYGALSVTVGLSYLLPFAPVAILQDRVLGLSAIVFMQLGFLLCLRSYMQTVVVGLAIIASFYYGGSISPLTSWGHYFGFGLGFVAGLFFRFLIKVK